MLGLKNVPHFQRYRLPRFSTDGFDQSLVELSIPQEHSVLPAKPLNFSKQGLAFQVEEESGFPAGRIQKIDRLRFAAFGRTFFEGPVEIRHWRLEEGYYIVGVYTQDREINVEEVLGSQIGHQIIYGQNGYTGIPEKLKLSEEYQLGVVQFRDYLSSMKEALEKTEIEITGFPVEEQNKIGQAVIQSLEKPFQEKFDSYFARLTALCAPLQENELFVYKHYFQSHLHDFILLCPFAKRCVDKPLGYSGDYEVMNMIYGDHYQGSSLFAKLENRCMCTIAPARANMDRLNFLKDKLLDTVTEKLKTQETVKITSLGSGPAKEIYDFIDTNSMSDRCVFTCVDLEPKALEYSQQTLTDVARRRNRNVQLNFVLANVVSYLRSKPQEFMFEQDLIYASGLFDYLKQSVGQKLTESVFPLVKNGGEFILVNASFTNPYKLGMEFAGEWYLNYRSKEEVLDLVSRVQGYRQKDILLDKEQVYWFLSLKK